MKILPELKQFVRHHDNEEQRNEVREFILGERAPEIADAFGVTVERLREKLGEIEDDATLVRRVLLQIKDAEAKGRAARTDALAKRAQDSANALATFAYWHDGEAHFDLLSVLATVVTRRPDYLVFVADHWKVTIPMAKLFALESLDRGDLTAFVDVKGLHVRFGKVGRLNFLPVSTPVVDPIVFAFPARAVAAVAAE